MQVLFLIILSTLFVSLLSFVGILTLLMKKRVLEKILLSLVALSAGALMGGAFLHLIPEALESSANVFIYVLFGFILFFLVEKVLHWRHCHNEKCEIHSFAYMSLFGDGVHNFIDGLIIAASFVADIGLGIVTVFAIVLHEVPQEIGDFGVLLYAGFNKKKALFLNFLTALTALFGGVLGYFLVGYFENFLGFLLGFAAGGFIYIAASDLIPEIRKEAKFSKLVSNFSIFLAGIIIMYWIGL